MLRFQLNFKSGKPVYLQLVDQVKAAAASGAVQPGDPLPVASGRSPRSCASTAIPSPRRTPSSRARASSRRSPARAVSSASNGSPFRKDVRRKLVAETIDEAVVQAHHLQIDKAEFLRLAEDRFDAFERKRARARDGMREL